jgi:hypothetical protein
MKRGVLRYQADFYKQVTFTSSSNSIHRLPSYHIQDRPDETPLGAVGVSNHTSRRRPGGVLDPTRAVVFCECGSGRSVVGACLSCDSTGVEDSRLGTKGEGYGEEGRERERGREEMVTVQRYRNSGWVRSWWR